jgi:hypothetical protein
MKGFNRGDIDRYTDFDDLDVDEIRLMVRIIRRWQVLLVLVIPLGVIVGLYVCVVFSK